jgi:hypothetical protein
MRCFVRTVIIVLTALISKGQDREGKQTVLRMLPAEWDWEYLTIIVGSSGTHEPEW